MPQLLSATEIANLALSKLGPGGGYLTDLDTDATVAAEALRRVYVGIRDEVLESGSWDFATKRASIAVDVTAPTWGYAYRYALPSDFLRLRAILGFAVLAGAAYTIEDGYILTDIETPLKIRYIARVTVTTKFSPTFVAALAARLADEVCETITKSTARRERLQLEYRAKLMEARRADGRGRAPTPPPEGSWNDARRGP